MNNRFAQLYPFVNCCSPNLCAVCGARYYFIARSFRVFSSSSPAALLPPTHPTLWATWCHLGSRRRLAVAGLDRRRSLSMLRIVTTMASVAPAARHSLGAPNGASRLLPEPEQSLPRARPPSLDGVRLSYPDAFPCQSNDVCSDGAVRRTSLSVKCRLL